MTDKDKTKAVDFINRFDYFKRVPNSGNVIIHPGFSYGFMELKAEFVDELKNHLIKKISMAQHHIDELSPTDKFAIMLLKDAY